MKDYYGIRYLVTKVTDAEVRQDWHYLNNLFNGRELAEQYVDRYVNGDNSEGINLRQAFTEIYDGATIDWQIVQMIPADALSDAIETLLDM